MPEWLKGADCKSAASRYVGSNPTRPIYSIYEIVFNFLVVSYNPTILIKIRYKVIINNKLKIINSIRDLGFLKRFRNGVKITKIKPTKLLIKNRG